MSRPGLRPLPAFDPAALVRMGRDVDDQRVAAAFASRYRQLLAARVDRITGALSADDVAAALDATLSLKVSSHTVGTCELAEMASTIEGDVRRADVRAARRAAAQLRTAAARADLALAAYLSA